jgi:hypothetical protein
VFGAISDLPPPVLPLLWISAWIGASVIFRVRSGKPLRPTAVPGSRFLERGASGGCLDTPWERLGGARNCLLVALTDSELYITPQFPFNLMFLPEIYGVEEHIPLNRIRSFTSIDRWYGKSIRVDFTRANGSDGTFSLRLRKQREFLDVLETLVQWPSNNRPSGRDA